MSLCSCELLVTLLYSLNNSMRSRFNLNLSYMSRQVSENACKIPCVCTNDWWCSILHACNYTQYVSLLHVYSNTHASQASCNLYKLRAICTEEPDRDFFASWFSIMSSYKPYSILRVIVYGDLLRSLNSFIQAFFLNTRAFFTTHMQFALEPAGSFLLHGAH